jgi:hypothetical protein
MDTRIQHENEPSQDPSAIFWHAKDLAIAHEVAAGAWETPPAVMRWHKMPLRMARWFYDQSRIWKFPLSCVHLWSISGQCDASIGQTKPKCYSNPLHIGILDYIYAWTTRAKFHLRPRVWEITLFSVSSQIYDHLCVWKFPLNSMLLGDKDCLHWIWPVK